MNVAGFEEALQSSLAIELEPGLVIAVASLPGLTILKILAWADRHMANNKDAVDLYRILTTFDNGENLDRIYDREIELLETAGFDLTLAGAELLGRDVAHIADPATTAQIVKRLNSEVRVDLLISHMANRFTFDDNTGRIAQVPECFRRGFIDAVSAT
jgi:predicted nucleotidyltransferase